MSKSFHILSFILLFWLAFSEKGRCCLDEHPTHNYYMVSFAERRQDRTPFQKEINAFWHDYTKGKYNS